MNSSSLLTIGFYVILTFVGLSLGKMDGKPQVFKISKTWDNQTINANQEVTLNFSSAHNGLAIDIHAPFYDSKLPSVKQGRFDRLFDFDEVVLFFFSSTTMNYLELQFGPGGHYLAYYLNGVREVRNDSVIIPDYTASIDKSDNTWTGKAFIPSDEFPAGVDRFNAYSAHGAGKQPIRVYLALYPVSFNSSKAVDMHNIDTFMPIDLSELIQIREPDVIVHHSSNANSFVSFHSFIPMLLCTLMYLFF